MAIHWHWAWGNESPTLLRDNAGFHFDNVASANVSSTDPFTYTGSPTRYSMVLAGVGNRGMTLPSAAAPGPIGACAIAVRHPTGPWSLVATRLIEAQSVDPADTSSVYIQFAYQSLALYVDNILKETTDNYDWVNWHYVTLKWAMNTTTWSGQIFVDGVAATTLQTDAATSAVDAVQIRIEGGANEEDTYIGQIITHDNISDSSEVRRYVTRVEAVADGTNIGVWIAAGAGTDFSELDSPINPANYTEETTPAVNDRVEVLVDDGGGNDLDTALGVTTSNIDSVCVHQISKGQGATVRAICGDSTGATETNGATVAVASNTSGYSVATANLRPTGAATWVGTDKPELILEVVSI